MYSARYLIFFATVLLLDQFNSLACQVTHESLSRLRRGLIITSVEMQHKI